MVRSSRIDMVTYPRMNQKLDIIIMKLKRAARGALIKKKKNAKRGGNRRKRCYENIYLFILRGNFVFCQVSSC